MAVDYRYPVRIDDYLLSAVSHRSAIDFQHYKMVKFVGVLYGDEKRKRGRRLLCKADTKYMYRD